MTLWLIGGTQESAELARSLVQLQLPCLVTVTTESARSLYPSAPTLKVWVGLLTAEQAKTFLQTHQIGCILDASHPFATEISKLAIATAEHYHLPYLRFERPTGSSSLPDTPIYPTLLADDPLPASPPALSPLHFNTCQTLLTTSHLTGHRVLLTMGYKSLHWFQPWHDRATLFARILPSAIALGAALQAGFTSERLIALRPPISAELERALWQQWQISMVVTKASGVAGGEDIKRQVAAELGVQLVIIDRPPVPYPQQTSDLQTALTFCQQNLSDKSRIQTPNSKL
jgi:precorrin-6A/cobalt-precorrin-6A reductase